MTKYLSMNGTSDYLTLPTHLQVNYVEIDWLLYADANSFKVPYGNLNDYTKLNTDGTFVTGSTYITINSGGGLISGQRVTTKITISRLDGYNSLFKGYGYYGNSQFLTKGNLYSAKFYNGSILVAHYDMSTGTVNDQSGNGNNATLYGGTWLDDGAGTSGTPVTYTYDTKQIQYANTQTNYDTKQSIYSNQSTNFDTKQSIYKPINQSYDTKQAIYKEIQELFDTEKVFTQAYTQVSYTYDMKIQQYKDTKVSIDTKQSYYTDISVDLDTKQVIYKQIQNLYDTLIQIRNNHDETLYGTLTIQRVIEHRLTINKRHSEDLKIERVLNHILRV